MKSKLRIKGNDRGLMMLSRDVRRRWLQYGENRHLPEGCCVLCNREDGTEIDHIDAVGTRPRVPDEFGPYITKMFYGKCQRLGKKCHLKKTGEDRKRRIK